MSDISVWISLGLGLVGLGLTIVGTAIKLTWWLGDRLDKITTATAAALNDHELKDEERHRDMVERVTRVETIVLNGSVRRHLV